MFNWLQSLLSRPARKRFGDVPADLAQAPAKNLARYVTWNPEDLAEFNEALAAQRSADDPLGR